MKYTKYVIAVLSFCFLGITPNENPSLLLSTNCHQQFQFFFFSEDNPTFWIGEDLSGECVSSRLLNISINDPSVSFSQSVLKEYKVWGDIPKLASLFRTFQEQSLGEIKISAPLYDSLLAEEFIEHIRQGGDNAKSWIKLKGNNGIKLPQIEGLKAELIFSYSTGLYINYEISEVHYFPNAYILIITHQPTLAVGLDTMHGFMIFKITSAL